MRSEPTFRVSCALLLILPLFGWAADHALADTVYVNRNGSENYTSIQAAVNDLPNPGPRTVIVRAGTYN